MNASAVHALAHLTAASGFLTGTLGVVLLGGADGAVGAALVCVGTILALAGVCAVLVLRSPP